MPGKNGGGGKPGGGDGGGTNQINGGRKNDVLIGTDGNDAIFGKDGDDILIGKGGGDLDADPATVDLLMGGNGDDILIGDFGTVEADGTVVIEETANDGDDHLFGNDGNDQLYGGGGNDQLQGGAGYDIIDGGSGFDIALYTADGSDVGGIVVTPYENSADDYGFDIHFVDPQFTDEQAKRIEGIAGTYYDDMMTGSLTRVNWFDGYYGNDSITGGNEADCINGGGDNDTIAGLDGNDELLGGSGDDSIDGGAGNDWIDGGSNAWWDVPDQDTIDGGTGTDTIMGGGGADILTGGADADTFVYLSASEGGDTITDFSGYGADGDTIDLTALGLGDGGTHADLLGFLIAEGYIFLGGGGSELYVDLDGGGPADLTNDLPPVPANDDVLIATSTGMAFDLDNDILV